MNGSRACVALCLLVFVCACAVANDEVTPEAEMAEAATPAPAEREFVVVGDAAMRDYWLCPGFFAGLGGSYNSVKLDQTFNGSADTDVYSGSTLVAYGEAGGPAPPFHSTLSTFAPVAQLGYMRSFCADGWWGTKFAYKYLGLTFTDQDVESPQSGAFTTTADAPADTTFTGHATAQSAQTAVNHELALITFLGRSFGSASVYLGGGPVVFATQSRIYDLSAYADINGMPTNIGGAPINFCSSTWMCGGAAQIGLIYFLSPSCFLDCSYDLMATGPYTQNYSTPFTSESDGYTQVGTLFVTTQQRVLAQSATVSFNLRF